MEDSKIKELFSLYMKVVGVPNLEEDRYPGLDPRLVGKKLGVINGSSWVILWSYFFGKRILPGVKIINVGNDAVQYNFMKAHKEGKPCPPNENIEAFKRYAIDLVSLYKPDAILISCSTMNRAYVHVREALKLYNIPVISIDMPMMEDAVRLVDRGKILVIATHGPTVKSTQLLLQEVADSMNKKVSFLGETVEEAFELLGKGNIEEHNKIIADIIRRYIKEEKIDVVVLAQLSMSVFKFSYPEDIKEFGVSVLTSGECGFRKIREIFLERNSMEVQ